MIYRPAENMLHVLNDTQVSAQDYSTANFFFVRLYNRAEEACVMELSAKFDREMQTLKTMLRNQRETYFSTHS